MADNKSLVDFYAQLAQTRLRLRSRKAIQRAAETAGQQGAEGPAGPPGPQGPQGDVGPAPEHRWEGTSLQFQEPSGAWGPLVDLQGVPGPMRMVAGGGGGGPNYGVFGVGMNGLTPAVTAGDTSSFLRGDGTWGQPNGYFPTGW